RRRAAVHPGGHRPERPAQQGSPGMPRPALHTAACDLFDVQYPIVQTGMGWVAGARLTSATSAAGALGILAAATMTFDQLIDAIHEVKSRTDRPFGVNLRADQADIDRRIDLLIRERVRVASFAQAPGERILKQLRAAGAPASRRCGPWARPVMQRRWRRGASTPLSRRAPRAAATPAPSPRRCCSPRSWTRSTCLCSPPAGSPTGAG